MAPGQIYCVMTNKRYGGADREPGLARQDCPRQILEDVNAKNYE